MQERSPRGARRAEQRIDVLTQGGWDEGPGGAGAVLTVEP